jgi:hypothetical protein
MNYRVGDMFLVPTHEVGIIKLRDHEGLWDWNFDWLDGRNVLVNSFKENSRFDKTLWPIKKNTVYTNKRITISIIFHTENRMEFVLEIKRQLNYL